MNIWFNTLIYIYISSHHLFIKPLTKREIHRLRCRAWSVRPVFSFHENVNLYISMYLYTYSSFHQNNNQSVSKNILVTV